jgi:hypothetical protein
LQIESALGLWTLTWSEPAQDLYLNNILVHKLGHLVDDRNSNYMDRVRFASRHVSFLPLLRVMPS